MKRDESTYDFVADLYRNIDATVDAPDAAQGSEEDASAARDLPPDDAELESLSQALQMFRDDAASLPEPDGSLSLAILKQEKLLRNTAPAAQPWWEKILASMMHPAFGAATLVLILGGAGLYHLLKAPPMQNAMQAPESKMAARPMSASPAAAAANDDKSEKVQTEKPGQIHQAKDSVAVVPVLRDQALNKTAPIARPVTSWTESKKQKAATRYKAERKAQSQKMAKVATGTSSTKNPASADQGSWGGFAPQQNKAAKPSRAVAAEKQKAQGKDAEQILAGSAGQLSEPSLMDMDSHKGGGGATGFSLASKVQKEDSLVADRETPAEEAANPNLKEAYDKRPVDDAIDALAEREELDSAPAQAPATAPSPAKKRRSRASAKAKTKRKASAAPPQAAQDEAMPSSAAESLPGLRSRSDARSESGAGKSRAAGRGGLEEMNRNRMQRQALDQWVAGQRAFKMRHYQEALGLFSRVEQMQQRGKLGKQARLMRARSLFKLKRFREASKIYEWALRSHVTLDNRAQIIDELANCYKHMGQQNKAQLLRQGERTPAAQQQ